MDFKLQAAFDKWEASFDALYRYLEDATTPTPASTPAITTDGVVGPVPASSSMAKLVTAAVVATDISSSTAKAPEVLHDASSDCIEMVHTTCSTECSTQVVAIASVDEIHDATTTVQQLRSVQSIPCIGTNTTCTWDPGVPLSGLCAHLQAEKIHKWMVSLVELQHWPFWEASYLVPIVVRTISDKGHEIMKLHRVTGEGALILPANYSNVELRPLPWPSFSCKFQAVQVRSALFKFVPEHVSEVTSSFSLQKSWSASDIYKTQAHWKFCEHQILEHAAVSCFPRPDKMPETISIMNMSVQWQFFNQEEFQRSGRFTRDCGSEQCDDPCVLLACLMVQPICCAEQPFSYLQGTHQQAGHLLDRVPYIAEHAKRGSGVIHTEQVNYKGVQFSPCCLVQPQEGGKHFIHCETAYGFYLELLALVGKMWKSDHYLISHLCVVQWHHLLLGSMCSTSYTSHASITCWLEQQKEKAYSLLAAAELTLRPMYMRIFQAVEIFREQLSLLQAQHLAPINFSTEFRSNLRTNSESLHITGLHLEFPQFWVATYDISTSSFSRALMVLLFELPFPPCTEVTDGNLAAYLNSCGANASGNCIRWICFAQLEKLWTTRTQEYVSRRRWSEHLSGALRRHLDPGEGQQNSEGISEHYADLTNASAVIWVAYHADEVHKSLDTGAISMRTSDLQHPTILRVLVISKRASTMGGITFSTCYNQDHFQEGRGVITVNAIFAQRFVGYEHYLDFDHDFADIGHGLDWIYIHHNYYFHIVEAYSDFDYHRDSDYVREHRVHWDPGGWQWFRLGVKPSFKKGGMLGASGNI